MIINHFYKLFKKAGLFLCSDFVTTLYLTFFQFLFTDELFHKYTFLQSVNTPPDFLFVFFCLR